jgi:hypothetical protein
MAYIEANIPPMKAWVNRGYFVNKPNEDKGWERVVVISVRCLEGTAALFQCLTESGLMRDKLPIEALYHEIPDGNAKKYKFHELQLWDCFSKDFSIVQLGYVYNSIVDLRMKDGSMEKGNYLWTIQWGSNNNNHCDLTLSEDPTEHKSHHFISLDNGQFALQPNNRIMRWHEPSFVTKKPSGERWEANTMEWHCEQFDRWETEDSNAFDYEIVSDKK